MHTHTLVEEALKDMSLEAVSAIARGAGVAVVQEWCGEVYISLTMLNMRVGVWHIGVPSRGLPLLATDSFDTAVSEMTRLIEQAQGEAVAA